MRTLSSYDARAALELREWQQQMLRKPGLINRAAKGVQRKINSYIPEKVHAAVTGVIKQMTRAVLSGSNLAAPALLREGSLQEREATIRQRIEAYRKTAAVEGGITGAGGLLLGLADFPLLFGIKIKLLFDIAALYGYSGTDLRERIYLLYIFQLAFSSDEHRRDVYLKMVDWREQRERLPDSLDHLDWRSFQQEYRDYIDLAKLAQLVPIIGAPVGLIVNYRLIRKLGDTAMNAYRMRWFDEDAKRLTQSSQSPQRG